MNEEKFYFLLNRNGGIHNAIADLNLDDLKYFITEMEKFPAPLPCNPYPSLTEIVRYLSWHSFVDKNETAADFARTCRMPLPDKAYEVLALLLPRCPEEKRKPRACFEQFFFQPLVQMDMKFVRHLWELKPLKEDRIHMKFANLYHTVLEDYCYIHLPTWEGLPEVFPADQNETLKILAAHAEKCGAPPPKHLAFLIQQGCTDNQTLQLRVTNPSFRLQVGCDEDGIPEWSLQNNISDHKHQAAEDLVNAAIKSGEYWPFTCSCGVPACSGISEPVLSMRCGDSVRWRIIPGEDGIKKNMPVRYVSYSVEKYLKMVIPLLDAILDSMKDNLIDPRDFLTGVAKKRYYPTADITSFSPTEINCKLLQKIRSQAKKALQNLKKNGC